MTLVEDRRAAARARMLAQHADPSFQAKRLAGLRGELGPSSRSVRPPPWVPRRIAADFRIIAARHGRGFAETWARAVKEALAQRTALNVEDSPRHG